MTKKQEYRIQKTKVVLGIIALGVSIYGIYLLYDVDRILHTLFSK